MNPVAYRYHLSNTSYVVVWTRLYVDTAKLLRELSIPACINADDKRRTVVALAVRFILSYGESFPAWRRHESLAEQS
jgi:hypothetical protein